MLCVRIQCSTAHRLLQKRSLGDVSISVRPTDTMGMLPAPNTRVGVSVGVGARAEDRAREGVELGAWFRYWNGTGMALTCPWKPGLAVEWCWNGPGMPRNELECLGEWPWNGAGMGLERPWSGPGTSWNGPRTCWNGAGTVLECAGMVENCVQG
jgi:hypothetical protein